MGGLPDGIQGFLNLGFQGALLTTILGSITWQLVAGAFPVAFLSNPVTYILLRICLLLEATGICNGAWVLAASVKLTCLLSLALQELIFLDLTTHLSHSVILR